MTNEVVKKESAPDILAIIGAVAQNPDVDVTKLQSLLAMQKEIMEKNAEIAFNLAMSELQPKIPEIHKSSKAHNSKYAKYEDVDRAIRGLYTEAGFSPSFNSKREADGTTTYYGILAHKDGHTKTYEINLKDDNSGSKNPVQAVASTLSYARRYLLQCMFNVICTDEDNDASSILTISVEKSEKIKTLIKDSGADVKAFLKFMNVESADQILDKDYMKAVTALEAKKRGTK